MPLPLDLSGKRFGRLKALRLDKTNTDISRLWVCRCDCGNTVVVRAGCLRSGHTKSCGCIRRKRTRGAFTKDAARRAHDEKLVIVDAGGEWLAPRAAQRHIGRSYPTLVKWAVACPILGGQGIRTRVFESAYGRRIAYYLKDDLDKVRDSYAALQTIPQLPELVYAPEAARQIGVSARTLRRRQAAAGPDARTVKEPGKSKDGRARPRSHVPAVFVQACRADRQQDPVPPNKMTAKAAAERLNVSNSDIHNLIAAGLLNGDLGCGVTKAKAGERGISLRYHRKAMLVCRDVVERLHSALLSPPPLPTQPRPGRPPSLLRQLAEMLAAGTLPDTASRPRATPETTHAEAKALGDASGRASGSAAPAVTAVDAMPNQLQGMARPAKQKAKRKRGRQAGSRMAGVVERDRKVIADGRAGNYSDATELAHAWRLDPSYVRKLLKRHGIRLGKNP